MLRKDGQKKKSGGSRPNSGKKPLIDKKEQFPVSFRESIINKFGGVQVLKMKISELIENELEKML